jgi:sugar phosphate isomerase/epimerase
LARFGPATIMSITGPAGDLGEVRSRAIVVEGLRALAEAAEGSGTRIGIEPMRESFRPTWTMVSSLDETFALLDEVGRDDLGIIFDLWHLWDSRDVHTLLGEAVARMHAVQVADYRDPTRGPLDRVAAGEGVADIPRFLRELRTAGYIGWYDLEVFSDDGRFGSEYEDSLWKLEPLEFGKRQMDGFLRCWGPGAEGPSSDLKG